MFEQPDGWLRASLPKMEASNRAIIELSRNIQNPDSYNNAQFIFQRHHWLKLTGVEPARSRFSIIVPVHDEERSLPSFLGALLTSEIPPIVDAQIIFVVNASSDQSDALIKRRLAHINHHVEIILPDSTYDPKRSNKAYQVCRNKIRFLVVETPVAGKANALNIGNEIARQTGHRLAINIDANNWVEPDSIALMYGRANRAVVDGLERNVVIINAKEYCPTRNTQVQVSVKHKTQNAEVTGCMFGWSTDWIYENGGFPQQSIEDYSTGLLALSQKKEIVESEANIWVYSAANFCDENRELARFIYGAMQLARQFSSDPATTQILLEDFPYLRPIGSRLKYYLFQRLKNKHFWGFIRGALRWFFNELLILTARQKMRRNPDGQTWEPIRSTK